MEESELLNFIGSERPVVITFIDDQKVAAVFTSMRSRTVGKDNNTDGFHSVYYNEINETKYLAENVLVMKEEVVNVSKNGIKQVVWL
jgi:hypothetical protein